LEIKSLYIDSQKSHSLQIH